MTKLWDRTEATKAMNVSPNTFAKMVRLGLPYVLVGEKKYYREVDIDAFLKEHTHSEKAFSYSTDTVSQNE